MKTGRLTAAFILSLGLLLGTYLAGGASPAVAESGGDLTLVSVSTDGTPGNYASFTPSISADGRYVAFSSDATNLVTSDVNGTVWDIFVRDLQTGTTVLVSVASDGTQGNGGSYDPAISADGRYVAFSSNATNLVDIDINGQTHLYDTLPTATTYLPQSTWASSGALTDTNGIRWRGEIPAGAAVTVTFRATVTTGTLIENRVSVTDTYGTPYHLTAYVNSARVYLPLVLR